MYGGISYTPQAGMSTTSIAKSGKGENVMTDALLKI
jgi:hypothetical protein